MRAAPTSAAASDFATGRHLSWTSDVGSNSTVAFVVLCARGLLKGQRTLIRQSATSAVVRGSYAHPDQSVVGSRQHGGLSWDWSRIVDAHSR